MEDNNVLFVRTNDSNDEHIWDDSVLIKAYDKAINLAKEEVSTRIGIDNPYTTSKSKVQQQKQSHTTNKQKKKWYVGSPCRSVYSEDGEIYEAVIIKIFENYGTCIVKYIGYGNTEKVELSSLLESEGLHSQIAQEKDALTDKCYEENMDHSESGSDCNSRKVNSTTDEKTGFDTQQRESKSYIDSGPYVNSFSNMMPPAPPLPPQLMAKFPENDIDALTSMLMSWYISGFHTGYYHGLQHGKDRHMKKKN